MRSFKELSNEEQIKVKSRFVLPNNTSKVEVDVYLRPFERISGALIGCTVINTNFHIHENKNK